MKATEHYIRVRKTTNEKVSWKDSVKKGNKSLNSADPAKKLKEG